MNRFGPRTSLLSILALSFALAACHDDTPPTPTVDAGPIDGGSPVPASTAHSSSIALSTDGSTLYVVNADADSVSVIDTASRALSREILLTGEHPAADPDAGSFTPAMMPRTLALSPDGKTLYVSAERGGSLLAIDLAAGTVSHSVAVGSEPLGVLVSPDGASIYVACSNDDKVVRVDASSFAVSATATTLRKPWALAWSDNGTLLVTHLLSPSVSAINPANFTATPTVWTVPDEAPRGDKRLAHGQPRGLYDIAARPGTHELWITHILLGTDTAQPNLDFESTAFPTVSVLHDDGTFEQRLSTDAQDVPGVDGAFADVVSGPHALTFTKDGNFALMVDTDSEDVMAIDTNRHIQATLIRPLPGHIPEGIVLSPDEKFAYVDERNTSDVAVVSITRTGDSIALDIDGTPISRLSADPMPPTIRFGQRLFYSANSSEYALTTDHWISCATCHLEGRSDAVTWLFAQGPRDTPTNAGGTLHTGFLFRTADRNQVQQYWHTIDIEQGGNFINGTDPTLVPLLDAIATYVNYGIPQPVPQTTDATLVAQGNEIFHRASVGCATCHSGDAFTDSGAGNPTLDLAGPIMLHDVGTCVTNPYPDVAHLDVNGDPRAACMFDTPSLLGVAESAPYLHDGSAATLHDVLEMTRGKMGDISSLSSDDEDALVEYLRSL